MHNIFCISNGRFVQGNALQSICPVSYAKQLGNQTNELMKYGNLRCLPRSSNIPSKLVYDVPSLLEL